MAVARAFCLGLLLAGCTNDFDALDVEGPAGGSGDVAATSGGGNTSAAGGAAATTGSASGTPSSSASASASATTGGGGEPGGAGSGGAGGDTSSASSGSGGSTPCADEYPGALICARSETQCEVVAATAVDSCTTFCSSHGAVCLGAWNNLPVGTCTFYETLDCFTVGHQDLVCICAKK